MKDRINRAKQYLSDHQNEALGIAGAAVFGVFVGSKLNHKHTILTATPDELLTLLEDENWSMSWEIAKRNTISLVKIPTRSS